MTEYVLSIDPGVSTGIALIGYEQDSAPTLEGAWQFTGGVSGIKRWLKWHYQEGWYDRDRGDYYPAKLTPSSTGQYPGATLEDDFDDIWDEVTGEYRSDLVARRQVTVISEKFTARNTKGFAYITASMEPLRGEGVLIALDLMPDYTPKEKRWRDPGLQYLVGGKDLADKKKRQHKFLKDIGFYRTNKDFPDSPSKDGADDFRSAAAHGLAYLARELHHKPTFELLSSWEG